MNKHTLKTVLGNYDYETIEKNGNEYVVTISKTTGNRYLNKQEIPKPVLSFLKKCNYKIELLDATALNALLGLS